MSVSMESNKKVGFFPTSEEWLELWEKGQVVNGVLFEIAVLGILMAISRLL